MTSKNTNAVKRTRATNFSFAEKELLLKYVIENNHILENKESSAVSWKDKNDCWVKISELYNSTTTGCVSTFLFLLSLSLETRTSVVFCVHGRLCYQCHKCISEHKADPDAHMIRNT